MKRVFILGAGASAPAGVPTTSELLSKAREHLKEDGLCWLIEEENDTFTPEAIVARLWSSFLLRSNPEWVFLEPRDYLTQKLDGITSSQCIDYSIKLLESLSTAFVDLSKIEYLKCLLPNLNTETAVFTTNFDKVLEVLAHTNGYHPVDICESRADHSFPNAFKFGKLYGTIDKCLIDAIEFSPHGQILGSLSVQSQVHFHENPRFRISLAQPRVDLAFSILTNHLADAEHLIIVGCSFSDNGLNSLLRNWRLNNPHTRVTIVSRSDSRSAAARHVIENALFVKSDSKAYFEQLLHSRSFV